MNSFRLVLTVMMSAFLLTGCASKAKPFEIKPYKAPETFPIYLKVDFGPSGKPFYEETIYVEKGMTAKEAVSLSMPIRSGRSCCSLKELYEIDGVAVDPVNKRWWICLLNDSKSFSPHQKELQKGDIIEWKYIQEA
jgi:hypothetical protein